MEYGLLLFYSQIDYDSTYFDLQYANGWLMYVILVPET